MLITRAEGAVIHELDGRPALEVYLSERGAALKDDVRSFGEKCLERPIGIPNGAGGHDLRQIHEYHARRRPVLTTAVPEQTVIRVMATDADALLAGARDAADAALAELGEPPELRGRLLVLHARPADAASASAKRSRRSARPRRRAGGGFYTFGEFGRVAGSIGIHNSSVALLCL